ncbi:MAG TPA: hypothetical protein PKY37_01675 [Paludibacteraceae bacterium]|nr:hypothetical protein [Paludibacteraceae bacterium]
MKKLVVIAASLASIVLILFSSCETPVTFDETLLIGKWERPSSNNGLECYRYDANYNGVTWDTGEDVSEAEGQPFTWSVESATMTHIHIMKMGPVVPKVYTLTTLNDSTLSYKDDYGVSFTFIKVK